MINLRMILSDNNHLKGFLGQHKNVYNVYKRSVDPGNFTLNVKVEVVADSIVFSKCSMLNILYFENFESQKLLNINEY